jgi:hypothetical protein
MGAPAPRSRLPNPPQNSLPRSARGRRGGWGSVQAQKTLQMRGHRPSDRSQQEVPAAQEQQTINRGGGRRPPPPVSSLWRRLGSACTPNEATPPRFLGFACACVHSILIFSSRKFSTSRIPAASMDMLLRRRTAHLPVTPLIFRAASALKSPTRYVA